MGAKPVWWEQGGAVFCSFGASYPHGILTFPPSYPTVLFCFLTSQDTRAGLLPGTKDVYHRDPGKGQNKNSKSRDKGCHYELAPEYARGAFQMLFSRIVAQ